MADSTLNQFVGSGTAAERAAFTPTPPSPASGPDAGYSFYETDTDMIYAWDSVGSAWIRVGVSIKFARKTADETVTSSTAFQDDDHLTFTIAANEIWTVQAHVFYTAATGGDLKTHFSLPTGAAGRHGSHRPEVGVSTAIGSGNWNVLSDFTTPGESIAGGGGTGAMLYKLETLIVVNGANAGSVTLRWAQNSSSGTATTVYTNSFLIAHRIG